MRAHRQASAHFGCSTAPGYHPGKRPPGNTCNRLPGGINPCLNSSAPGVQPSAFQFTTSRCDGTCGAPPPITPATPSPAIPPPPHTCVDSPECDVCPGCCRADVNCSACVAALCPLPGAAFFCAPGHGGRYLRLDQGHVTLDCHWLPLVEISHSIQSGVMRNEPLIVRPPSRHSSPAACALLATAPTPAQRAAGLFSDPNCTHPLGGGPRKNPAFLSRFQALNPCPGSGRKKYNLLARVMEN